MRWHMVPISNTAHSNIPFCLWLEQIMLRRVNYQHCSMGHLFKTRTGARAKFGRYNAKFQSLVALARAMNSRLVPNAIELNDFSLWQSPQGGAILKTTQQVLTPR